MQHRCSTRLAAMLQDKLHVFLLPVVPCLKFQVIFQVSTSMSDLKFLSDIFFVFRHYYDAPYSKALAWSLTISESLHATLCKAKAERILFVVVK